MSKMEEQAIELKEQYEKALKNFNELKAAGQDVSFLYAETNKRYKEILKLDALLTEEKVNHILGRFIDGWIVIVYTPDGENRLCDAVEHFGSYGQEEDKLEIMGALTESELKDGPVLGCLTAKECAKRFAYCYRKGSSVYSESDVADARPTVYIVSAPVVGQGSPDILLATLKLSEANDFKNLISSRYPDASINAVPLGIAVDAKLGKKGKHE